MAKRPGVRLMISPEGMNMTLQALAEVDTTIRSPEVTRIVQTGAEQMAGAARRLAVRGATGNLQRGIYTASKLKNQYVALFRRNGKPVTSPLRYPAVAGQVLVVSSVFYGRWVEKGRRERDVRPKNRFERQAKVGRQFNSRRRGRPFFRPGIRIGRPGAEAYIVSNLEKLIRNVTTVAG